MYGVNRNLYEDIKAAQILGTSEDFLYDRMDNRGEKKAFNAINEGEFRPLTLSDDLKELFSIRAEELNVTDPYDAAADIIDQIKDQLENITLGGDLFPDIQNPLDTNLVEGITDIVAGATLPNINTGFLGQGNVAILVIPCTKLVSKGFCISGNKSPPNVIFSNWSLIWSIISAAAS